MWIKRISFYYDGVSFVHKLHPFGDAMAPSGKIWRTKKEGLTLTAKGKKEGYNGKSVRLFVAIAHNKGVIMVEQWDPETRFTGENYRKFVVKHFPKAFRKSANPRNKLVLQDGCPVQKSVQAHLGYAEVGCKIFRIPARSPDLNPIENMFNEVRKKLSMQARDNRIMDESYEEFQTRVFETIKATPIDYINKTIESLHGRIGMVIRSKGKRIKY